MSRPRADRAGLVVGLVATLATLPAGAATPAAPELTVVLTPETMTVGDRVTAVLTVTVPEGSELGPPRFPAWDGSWGAAEVLDASAPERVGPPDGRTGDGAWRQRLTLTAFRPGTIRLPRRTVVLPRRRSGEPSEPSGPTPLELTTRDGLTLTVRSVLPEGVDPAAQEPTPAAPIHPLSAGRAFWWTLGAALALVAATCALLAARRRPGAREPARPEPLAELVDRLAALGPETQNGSGHVALSAALRTYLGRRLDFPATESTTTEVHRRLRDRHLPADVVTPTAEVLRACDRVKFARQRPAAGALAERADTVRAVAGRLEEHLQPAGEAQGGPEPDPGRRRAPSDGEEAA